MLADDDFRVCTTWRMPLHVVLLPRVVELRAEPRDRALEGAQDPLEQLVLAGRVELAQALQGRLVEHRVGAGTHAVTFSMFGNDGARVPDDAADAAAPTGPDVSFSARSGRT